jgi:hypothetical protein
MAISQRSKSRMSMWFAADLPVNPQALRAPGAENPTSDGSGQNSSTVAAELGRDGSWQKTLLESLALNLVESSGLLGSWRPWVSRSCPLSLAVMTWERPTVVREFSLWPTPVASDAQRRAPESSEGKLNRGSHTGWCVLDVTGFSPHPEFIEWLMGFPIGVDRTSALGNAIIPRFAYVAAAAIRDVEEKIYSATVK